MIITTRTFIHGAGGGPLFGFYTATPPIAVWTMETIQDVVQDYENLCTQIRLLDSENNNLKEHLTAALYTIQKLMRERYLDAKALTSL